MLFAEVFAVPVVDAEHQVKYQAHYRQNGYSDKPQQLTVCVPVIGQNNDRCADNNQCNKYGYEQTEGHKPLAYSSFLSLALGIPSWSRYLAMVLLATL